MLDGKHTEKPFACPLKNPAPARSYFDKAERTTADYTSRRSCGLSRNDSPVFNFPLKQVQMELLHIHL